MNLIGCVEETADHFPQPIESTSVYALRFYIYMSSFYNSLTKLHLTQNFPELQEQIELVIQTE